MIHKQEHRIAAEAAHLRRDEEELAPGHAPGSSNSAQAARAARVRAARGSQPAVQATLRPDAAARTEAPAPAAVHRAAALGTSGTATRLPYMEQIQASFGKHDVASIQAHVDEPAREGAATMGAEAFATGEHVAFGQTPTLRTAAHEAAHIVQQRGGVQLAGGVGRTGDAHEQHADQVADQVARGASAEHLLDAYADRSGSAAVQRSPAAGPVQKEPIERTVSPRAMHRLQLATQAIQHVNNEVLLYGAGNQREDIERTRGIAHLRTTALRDTSNRRTDLLPPDIGPEERSMAHAARWSVAAEHFHAGACDDYSRVTLTYLRKHANGEILNRVSARDVHHSFIIIGDLQNDRDDELVVADPWPTRPQACTWADCCFYSEDRPEPSVTFRADGRDDMKRHRKAVHFDEDKTPARKSLLSDEELAETMDRQRDANDLWDHRTTVATDEPIFYVLDSWDERTKARKKRELEEDLQRNRHVPPKALKRLGLD